MTAMLPAHLTEALNSLGDAARELTVETLADRADRQVERRQQRRRDRRTLVLIGVVAALVVALSLLALANRRTNEQNRRIVEQIDDCTRVGGECYEQSQQRTGDAIDALIRAQMATALCAKDPDNDTEPEMRVCVGKSLARRPPK